MVKVRCTICKATGFSASPGRVICKCGGRYCEVHEKTKEKQEEN